MVETLPRVGGLRRGNHRHSELTHLQRFCPAIRHTLVATKGDGDRDTTGTNQIDPGKTFGPLLRAGGMSAELVLGAWLENQTPKTGIRHSKPETFNPKPKTRNPTTHNQKTETKTQNPKPETQNSKTPNPKLEPQNPKPRNQNPKPKTLNLQPKTQNLTPNTPKSKTKTENRKPRNPIPKPDV